MTTREQLAVGVAIAALAWWLWSRRALVADVTTSETFALAGDDALGRFAYAIAVAEGYFDGNTVPYRKNNPGDLKLDGRVITTFPTPEAGWTALRAQLDRIARGASDYYTRSMTLAQMGVTWAAGDTNWAVNVGQALGVSTSTSIGDLL